jgi:hypothetical protein
VKNGLESFQFLADLTYSAWRILTSDLADLKKIILQRWNRTEELEEREHSSGRKN